MISEQGVGGSSRSAPVFVVGIGGRGSAPARGYLFQVIENFGSAGLSAP
jgi:hypothetical protein